MTTTTVKQATTLELIEELEKRTQETIDGSGVDWEAYKALVRIIRLYEAESLLN